MKSDDIRRTFLEFFERHGHEVRPSAPLVPRDDPTLMFTNAGMVPFKRVFLGEESLGIRRATTSQKCLRVSGKHNDLEEVGRTARHHTFFEMLGNFSFGDYFKRDAIDLAWRLFTNEYALPVERLWVTVHHSDDEAFRLWQEVAGLPERRIFRLGDKDNFWQMGDTGPCGPCSEIHFDMRPERERGTELDAEAFEAKGELGEFLELWNLVFMQFNRDAAGELHPLPSPSIDTGAGLERIASVLQGKDSNYETDLFLPLIERVAAVVGRPYERETEEGVSYRVLADHARATAFLLADGVFPSNAERGYVLRRIMRRGIRHAWLLGRRAPTLVEVVDEVVERMGDAFPELRERREHLLRATRMEEERFLATIDEGMVRFDQIAPAGGGGEISGDDVFRLYDTFGFPLDLTELMAEERGYRVDMAGFEAALEVQRRRSRDDRAAAGIEQGDDLAHGWTELEDAEQEFVGYEATEVETDVLAFRRQDGRAALQLRENPFYLESGGQVSDTGIVEGAGWRMVVDDVRRVGGRSAVIGDVEGEFPDDGPFAARAVVAAPTRRDTERNHTATHLLHAALRGILGSHVLQRGSLVAPERLRFDFSHNAPLTAEELRRVEDTVNEAILENEDVCIDFLDYDAAIQKGAMALFGEKYGDVVRMISVPGVSMELCGGTHVRQTGEIGLFRIVSETGTGAGVRRIEAVTGRAAYRRSVEQAETVRRAAEALRAPPEMVVRRIEQLQAENRELAKQLERTRREGASDVVGRLVESASSVDGARVVAEEVEVADQDALRALGDQLRDRLGSGVVVLAARSEERTALFTVVTDDLIGRGVRADRVVREVAQLTGGSGGGRPHMAQGGVGDPGRVAEALRQAPEIVRTLLEAGK
ncbi:MAG TPA: alanine--tRNA ligase [Longimicrobiales bacterium]|nr:alanine--tRNA ligase [Longimicrobiales bacterium]